MATNKEIVLRLLQDVSPKGLTNSDIVARTSINPHQQVFQITEALLKENLISGVRTGKEWSFNWPPNGVPLTQANRLINERTLVTSRRELLDSCLRFLELENGSPKERKFFAGRIKNVKRFVALPNLGGAFDFIPGAYAAYSDSRSLEEWQELGEGYRTPGRQYLDRVLYNDRIDNGHPDYALLIEAFQEFCSDRNIVPSISEDPMRFWMLSETQGAFDRVHSNRDETEYWTEKEFEAAVKAYAKMLRSGNGYKPFRRNETLKELKADALSNRSETSIIYRMKNISSVLATLGKPYLEGYKPAHHVGPTGIDKIAIYLEHEGLIDSSEFKHTLQNTSRTTLGNQKNKKVDSGIIFDAWQKTLWQIVSTVKGTTANSNGQIVERILKDKELRCSEEELKEHIIALRASQGSKCAITGIPLQCLGQEDPELIYSLDRIDSNGHYEPGNLQLVCRFVNRWKSDGDNAEFRRLIEIVRKQAL